MTKAQFNHYLAVAEGHPGRPAPNAWQSELGAQASRHGVRTSPFCVLTWHRDDDDAEGGWVVLRFESLYAREPEGYHPEINFEAILEWERLTERPYSDELDLEFLAAA